ncbi:hypothetical protein BDA99DRAFT_564939 [Phascolomyces articulosus]|uniref:Uncharacterized protein n=1 Tax=Phascolomyces articulosus TaxID=60185 RepID=A0AAD5K2B5_9FUNG|nr:hypothetical protein BDA99DRAFT_564939 [Phascolomyces articulosus]
MHIGHSKQEQKDDEENLISSNNASLGYGAINNNNDNNNNHQRTPTSSATSSLRRLHIFPHLHHDHDDGSSRASSEAEEPEKCGGESSCRDPRGTIAERKRRRMHRHHHAGSSGKLLLPRIMRRKGSNKKSTPSSSNSSCTGSDHEHHSSSSDSDTDDADDDDVLSRIATADLVLPALDPKADEVIASAASQKSLDQWFARRSHVNFSTVRAKYRSSRKSARDEKTEVYSMINQVRSYFHWHPYIAKIRDALFANQTIVAFVNIDLMVDLLFCLAYLFEMKQEFDVHLSPPWLYKWRSYDLWLFCQCLTCWNLGSFIMRIYLTGRPMSVLISFRCAIEMLTTVPFLISHFIEHGQFLYVPYFLRSWVLLLRIKSAMKIKTNLQMTDKPVDLLKSKLIHLVCTLITLLYNGMAAFQYCEATFVGVKYSIIDSLYLVMVTLSTVGYGDITPQTEASRVVVMVIIVTSLAVLPSLITDVLATVRKRNDGGGHVNHGVLPFILIVGAFRPDQENAERHLNVVFLDVNKPAEDLKLMERNSMWGHRIQFLHGSVLSDKTLQRARARYAKAIFTISDQNARNTAEEDERNTVRLWSLYCYTVTHNVPIYTYNLSPTTAIYQKVAKEIICVQEFKQYLLAMNCRCRGASTLLTNLLHQRQPMNRYDEPWHAQYDDGSCNEIYTAPPPEFMVGLTFAHCAWICFKECQVILFAIKTFAVDRGDHEILLNPSNDYIIKESDLCVYISESPREIKDIRYLNNVYVWQTVRALQTKRQPFPPPPPKKKSALGATVIVPSAPSSTSSNVVMNSMGPEPAETRSTPVDLSKPSKGHYKLSRLPTPRHALLSGSRALITRLGQTPVNDEEDDKVGSPEHIEDISLPLSYILEEPVKLQDSMIDSTENMRGHILVCVHREVVNIFKFIYNLRSPHMKPEDLQDIVLLCPSIPSEKTYELINMFPKVYFMVGSCRQPDDLLRAGVKTAKQVVVMSEKECLDDVERNSDSPAIMTSHIIDLLVQERARNAYTIVNLIEKSNIRFMHLLQDKDVAEEIDVFYTPAYAAGDVVADSLISNVLLSQTYYKPDIVSIIKTLCGMPGPLYDGSAAHLLSSSNQFRTPTSAAIHAPHLTSMPMPHEFVDQTFAHLFETLLLDHGVMPLGLLRAPSEALGNELPFVYANPVPSLILKESDRVYILSSPTWDYKSTAAAAAAAVSS